MGCGDSPTEPGAFLVARETQAALAVSEALPTLPRLAERSGAYRTNDPAAEPDLAQAVLLWLDAQAAAPEDALVLQAAARGLAAGPLAASLSTAALDSALSDLHRWIELATPLAARDERLGLTETLAGGRILAEEAARRAARGDRKGAVRAVLSAADRLQDTTPGAVARRLIRDVDTRLALRGIEVMERRPDPADERAVQLGRLRRLLDGARAAAAAGEYPLAIQRAYYAGQLLERLP